jgi:hypothetical protein
MSRFVRNLLFAALAGALAAATADAQLLGGGGVLGAVPLPVGGVVPGLPALGPAIQNILATPEAQQAVRPTLDDVGGVPETLAQSGPATLNQLRQLRLQQLVRQNHAILETDGSGQPVRRGILIAIDPDPALLQAATRAGFRVVAQDPDQQLGIGVVQLAVPPGMSARAALKLLEKVAPGIEADFDHLFEPAGGALRPVAGSLAASSADAAGRTVGMIDGGVASNPSLRTASIEQNGFAGPAKATGHGTAVASLLVGNAGPFHGAAPGARLYVADVYGGSEAAGSASGIVRALAWLASKHPQVINISLVGPPNRILERAIAAVRARGIEIVAAVGNDGPAAPPQYPASYPGVVSVTAVDEHGRALPEAGRPAHLDFAAPGADMAAALPGQGFARVRGTSFASPLVAARLLIAGSPQRLSAEAQPGHGRVGRGIVCAACRIDPRRVGAK